MLIAQGLAVALMGCNGERGDSGHVPGDGGPPDGGYADSGGDGGDGDGGNHPLCEGSEIEPNNTVDTAIQMTRIPPHPDDYCDIYVFNTITLRVGDRDPVDVVLAEVWAEQSCDNDRYSIDARVLDSEDPSAERALICIFDLSTTDFVNPDGTVDCSRAVASVVFGAWGYSNFIWDGEAPAGDCEPFPGFYIAVTPWWIVGRSTTTRVHVNVMYDPGCPDLDSGVPGDGGATCEPGP